MLVQQGRLAIRALQKSDAPVMLRWLQDERVLEFYEGRDKHFDLQTVIEVFIEDQGETTPCLVL
ncbi:GNAT family N-acetyltransferase, partial [Acinetobacter baumannii]|nr:GNAT family N-acetyltransferase [Acinetobacter baumannii]